MTIVPEPSFEEQLVAQRDYLLRFARLQLRNDAWARGRGVGNRAGGTGQTPILWQPLPTQDLAGRHSETQSDRRLRPTVAKSAAWPTAKRMTPTQLEYLGFKADGHFAQMPADWGNPVQQIRTAPVF
jgi:hypothetical protein